MACIYSDYDLAGNYNNLVVYWVGNQLYARTRSSLDGKRFRKDRAFKKAREKAKAFGVASQLAKEVYKSLYNNRFFMKRLLCLPYGMDRKGLKQGIKGDGYGWKCSGCWA